MHKIVLLSCAVLGLTVVAGCSTARSTMLNRLEGGGYAANSNGETGRNGITRPFKGIPITLKVPTHLEVYITETVYKKLAVNNGSASYTEPLDVRLYNVRTNVVHTPQLFTVDFKRPGAGSLDLTVDLTDEQYFDKITSVLKDETLNQSAELLKTVIEGIQTAADGPDQETLGQLKEITREFRDVAYMRFDINSPSFEQDVEDFVSNHLNMCDDCSSGPAYDLRK